MFAFAYGAMISYLMIIRDTIPLLLGVAPEDTFVRNVLLAGLTLVVIVPLSMKRDMADLAFTSFLSVVGDFLVVIVVAVYSPTRRSVEEHGGFMNIVAESTFRPRTVFVGVGVLSFAFVCQHSAFIVAKSLDRPTHRRWGKVTGYALALAGLVSLVCGVTGYVGFMEDTEGDVLNTFLQFDDDDRTSYLAVQWARGILGFTMFVTVSAAFAKQPPESVNIRSVHRRSCLSSHVCSIRWRSSSPGTSA
uniref:Amino acid transporter transmembrane domain-containing protein n=1 Tax=Corethron hystrix TaxID=216773 RepID=A0A7S1FR11_9STRA